ncbi:MAG: bestrophin family ion channel [Mariniblastus sp.]|nr:bestrophin family ion channel [Mariniblastus sp.]
MVVNSKIPFIKLISELFVHLIPILIYIGIISALDYQYHLEDFHFPLTIVAVLGTVIGLLLAFRTNSSYDRWWEARTLWGAIVNDSRTWTRQLLEFTPSENLDEAKKEKLKTMAYRQIAWCYALSRSLRKQTPDHELSCFLDSTEINRYRASHNVPNDLLLTQAGELQKLYRDGSLELFQFIELEKTLTRLTNSMGGCERIKNTKFPESYSLLVHLLIYVFVLFLPFGLVEVPALGLVVTSLFLAFAFLLIERVSVYLQDPFSNRSSDTPMLALSRTIEINIKQMLGDDEIPDPHKPVNGVLN